MESTHVVNFKTYRAGEILEFNLDDAFNEFEFPTCTNQLGRVRMHDFFAVELISDSNGLTASDLDFRQSYLNIDDENLADEAPIDMYIAKPIGFKTLVYYPIGMANNVDITLDLHQHLGRWDFKVRVCVDRRDERLD